jgi:putative nucleotidyltransferase with HDIG domain
MHASRHPVPFPVRGNFEIPSIPPVLIKIMQTLDEDAGSTKELQTLILHDPALSARLLRLANSAFYSFHAGVKTISQAVALLGANLVTSLALDINIFDPFTNGAKSEADLINKLWTHSRGVGMLAREIWMQRGQNEKEGEFAFLCGLLHDLGKVVLFKTYPGHYGSILAIPKSGTGPAISSYESKNYGMDHAAIGEMLARQWGFPTELVHVIGRHHDSLALDMPMVNAVMTADLLAKELKIGYDGDDGRLEGLTKLQSKLGISNAEYRHLQEFASRQRENIEGFFQFSS